MPYKSHSEFKDPEDNNIKIWRYMDISKFLNILFSKSLYFSLITQFDDPFEGSYPGPSKDIWGNIFLNYKKSNPGVEKTLDNFLKISKELRNELKQTLGINCWHMNTCESAAMWKLYLKSNEGIAIQSTIERLKNSFNDANEVVNIGIVKYLDYSNEIIDISNRLSIFFYKRKSFKHEEEIRAITNLKVIKGWDIGSRTGASISVDLKTLIEKVYISPDSPNYILHDLKKIIEEFNYDFPIVQSDMNIDPIF